jgi:hypothetical protein
MGEGITLVACCVCGRHIPQACPVCLAVNNEWVYVETFSEDRALEVYGLTRRTGEVRLASVHEPHIYRDGNTVYAVRPKSGLSRPTSEPAPSDPPAKAP